ncbi:hypothetical protein MIND_00234900 [Mycena indigotica]|uniref:F-box domain-containing protein n=1 Tax=Mycena indigotica TaxID=2126181 RepID=A0A8H6WH82_9AGAR|nr:uncharacterized protein MIND_00234900 [Mycena indigotica]KAF7312219.1 hypothetical protein MIND_00234900 [Mycena indigotica]
MAPLFSSSSITRVLAIPELLDLIFRYLDDKSNTSNALVCTQWSEVALNILWSNLSDLARLFRILRPLEKVAGDKDAVYAWSVAPDASDWKRLEKYTRRVRRLIFDADYGTPLEASVFEDASRTRTSLAILPNLVYLDWRAPLPLSVIFMSSHVKTFILWMPQDETSPTAEFRSFFRDVTTRMPNLTTLDIRTIIPMHDIEDDMVFLFESLTKLRKAVFPRYHVTTRIAETLARLEDFGCLEFQYHQDQGIGDPDDTSSVFRPKLQMGAFPSLWDVSMTVTLDDALAFMKQPFSPTNLTTLYVDSALIESPSIVQEFLESLSDSCQLLEGLGILAHIDNTDNRQLSDIPSDLRINFSNLQPLLVFPNLVTFELIHQFPLDLTIDNIQQLAQSWPSLRKLILNNEPAVSDHCDLTLGALLPFATHCRELEHLGLFINASSGDLPSAYAATTYQLKPFAKLRRLSTGTSLISEPGEVALFLSQICPLGIALDFGVTWDHAAPDDSESDTLERIDAIGIRCDKWAKAREHLPLLTKLRAEERSRTRLLTEEVTDLRMRSSVLLDTLQAGRGEDSCIPL